MSHLNLNKIDKFDFFDFKFKDRRLLVCNFWNCKIGLFNGIYGNFMNDLIVIDLLLGNA
jgi:hypothetical protein